MIVSQPEHEQDKIEIGWCPAPLLGLLYVTLFASVQP